MTEDEPRPQWGNQLLDRLPAEVQAAIAPHLTRVAVHRGTVTTIAGEPLLHVDFPIDALIAVIARTPSGQTIEVAVVGAEGYVETDGPLESDIAHRSSVCRLPGAVWRLPIDAFRACLRDAAFAALIRRVTRARFFVTEQAVLCNAHHTMDQRLARWLLVARDRSGREHFKVTQAELAAVLGVRRAGISLTVSRLRRAGAITNERGALMVADYGRLLDESCECYGVMRDALGGLPSSVQRAE
jgi:CRP-like cAMP-binding protein